MRLLQRLLLVELVRVRRVVIADPPDKLSLLLDNELFVRPLRPLLERLVAYADTALVLRALREVAQRATQHLLLGQGLGHLGEHAGTAHPVRHFRPRPDRALQLTLRVKLLVPDVGLHRSWDGHLLLHTRHLTALHVETCTPVVAQMRFLALLLLLHLLDALRRDYLRLNHSSDERLIAGAIVRQALVVDLDGDHLGGRKVLLFLLLLAILARRGVGLGQLVGLKRCLLLNTFEFAIDDDKRRVVR